MQHESASIVHAFMVTVREAHRCWIDLAVPSYPEVVDSILRVLSGHHGDLTVGQLREKLPSGCPRSKVSACLWALEAMGRVRYAQRRKYVVWSAKEAPLDEGNSSQEVGEVIRWFDDQTGPTTIPEFVRRFNIGYQLAYMQLNGLRLAGLLERADPIDREYQWQRSSQGEQSWLYHWLTEVPGLTQEAIAAKFHLEPVISRYGLLGLEAVGLAHRLRVDGKGAWWPGPAQDGTAIQRSMARAVLAQLRQTPLANINDLVDKFGVSRVTMYSAVGGLEAVGALKRHNYGRKTYWTVAHVGSLVKSPGVAGAPCR